MISVRKVPSGYVAEATPPHVRERWETAIAMPARALITELRARGAHQTDIGDALFAADPEWLKISN